MAKARVLVMGLWITLGVMGCIRSEEEAFGIHLLAEDVPAAVLTTLGLNELEIQEQPILASDDIVAYAWTTHEIKLTAEAYERIQQLFTLPVQVDGMRFVVVVGHRRIYAGAFWTPVSSLSFDGVVICQPLDLGKRAITIGLGYPCPDAFTGSDPRFDERIRTSLEAAGKLEQQK